MRRVLAFLFVAILAAAQAHVPTANGIPATNAARHPRTMSPIPPPITPWIIPMIIRPFTEPTNRDGHAPIKVRTASSCSMATVKHHNSNGRGFGVAPGEVITIDLWGSKEKGEHTNSY